MVGHTMPENVDWTSTQNTRFRELLTRVLLIATVACVGTLGGMAFYGGLWTTRSIAVVMGLAVVVLSYWQMRSSLRRAVIILVVGWWAAVTVGSVLFAGVHSANLTVYTFLIGLCGWILGRRWLVRVTAATVGFILLMSTLEVLGLYEPSPRASVMVVGFVNIATVVAVALLTELAHAAVAKGRDRAVWLSRDMAAQNQLLERRDRDLQMVLNQVPAAIASFDAQSRLRYGNLRYAALFGARPEELVGRHINDYVEPEGLQAVAPHWAKCLAGERVNYRRINRDPLTQAERLVDVELVPETDQGQVVGLFALMIDVTDEVAVQEHIKELNASLEKRVERRTQELNRALGTLQQSQEELARSETRAALSTMIASVSHELSTPLGNSLMTASTLVAQGQEFKAAVDSNKLTRSGLAAFVESVLSGNALLQRNLQRATDLLKSFRQVANDQASEERRNFDLATMVGEILETLRPSLKRQPHRIVVNIPEGFTLDSLPGALGQVIINLTNNAYLHAFEDRTDGVFTISAVASEHDVVLSMADNGTGIAPENLVRLFEPFFSTKKGKGGTGLGMGIVQTLVEKTLGGSIQVHSELGVGTRFEVRLPLKAPD
jgi:PAS domain S-box-containing protein